MLIGCCGVIVIYFASIMRLKSNIPQQKVSLRNRLKQITDLSREKTMLLLFPLMICQGVGSAFSAAKFPRIIIESNSYFILYFILYFIFIFILFYFILFLILFYF